MGDSPWLIPKSYLHRLEQGFLAEGLLQEVKGARLENLRPCYLVRTRRGENDQATGPGSGQQLVELQAVHARIREVQD